jgi:DNA polymerase-4
MDKIKNRFGFDAVTRCGGRILKSKTGNIISNPRAQFINLKNPE